MSRREVLDSKVFTRPWFFTRFLNHSQSTASKTHSQCWQMRGLRTQSHRNCNNFYLPFLSGWLQFCSNLFYILDLSFFAAHLSGETIQCCLVMSFSIRCTIKKEWVEQTVWRKESNSLRKVLLPQYAQPRFQRCLKHSEPFSHQWI